MKNNNTSGSFTDSEDDIDLRVYIDMLLCRKWIILGITLIAGAGAAIITFLQPPVYNATSLVAITRPLYQFQFSPNIQNTGEKDNYQQFSGKAGVELASSDSILEQVLKTVKNDLKPEERHLLRFKRKIKVTTGSEENKRAEIRKYADAIPAAILDLQGQLQRINMENGQLTRQRNLAESVVSEGAFSIS